MRASATRAQIARFTLHAGDVIITKDSETPDDIAVPAFVDPSAEGIVCGYHLAVLRPEHDRLFGKYLFWTLRSRPVAAAFSASAQGITRFGITIGAIGDVRVPVPGLPEQIIIAAFLDRETTKIDVLIAKQTEFLTRLDEHRRALITEAVTLGLDPSVPMRETGVETFSLIPEHWQVKPLKHAIRRGTSISYGIVQPGDHVPDGIPFVQTADLTQRRFDPSILPRTAPEIARAYPRSRLSAGDVLLGIRASIGDAVVAPTELDGANLSRGIARIVPSADFSAEYLVLVLSTPQTAWFWTLHMQGSTFREVSIETVRQLPVPAPPRHEQDSIVLYLKERLARFDAARGRSAEIIARLRERRAALITAAVTGQIDVTQPVMIEAAA
jgi:type I restriction enzyme S subunit